jgi:hypothetical protein
MWVPTWVVISMRSTFTPASLVKPSFRRRRMASRQVAHIIIRKGGWFGCMFGAPAPKTCERS